MALSQQEIVNPVTFQDPIDFERVRLSIASSLALHMRVIDTDAMMET